MYFYVCISRTEASKYLITVFWVKLNRGIQLHSGRDVGWIGISEGSAFASVESRGECWLGQLGEPMRLHVMRFKWAAAPLRKASVAAWHSGTIGRHLTALLRVSAVCLDRECLHFFKPMVRGKAFILLRTRKDPLYWCISPGSGLRQRGFLLLMSYI